MTFNSRQLEKSPGDEAGSLVYCIQSNPDNYNLQGKSKKIRVIGSSKKIAESKVKNSFYCTVNILITFNCRNVEGKLKDTCRL